MGNRDPKLVQVKGVTKLQKKSSKTLTGDIVTVYALWLMRWSRLAHQLYLSSEASGFGVLQKSRHCIVVQVIDEVPDPSLVCRSQLVCSQRRQRGTRGPSPTEITVTGRTQRQLWLHETNAESREKPNRLGLLHYL